MKSGDLQEPDCVRKLDTKVSWMKSSFGRRWDSPHPKLMAQTHSLPPAGPCASSAEAGLELSRQLLIFGTLGITRRDRQIGAHCRISKERMEVYGTKS